MQSLVPMLSWIVGEFHASSFMASVTGSLCIVVAEMLDI
jgi:hypothetical protein